MSPLEPGQVLQRQTGRFGPTVCSGLEFCVVVSLKVLIGFKASETLESGAEQVNTECTCCQKL